MNKNFWDFLEQFKSNKIALAVSGGIDSMALLHWFSASGLNAVVLTVDHNLRPESGAEAAHVKKVATGLGFKHETLIWNGDADTKNLESAARTGRYNLMINYCKKNNIDTIFTAHQSDDNIETFLMNLARGSGVYGLGGIRQITIRDDITIARPLLHVSRRELQNWCDENGVKYFNDSMNFDPNFTRVKIRQNRHILYDVLGISDSRILLAIDNLARARDALEKINPKIIDNRLDISANEFFAMADEIRLKFLSDALQRIGGDKYAPRLNQIKNLIKKIEIDTVATLAHCSVRRYGDKIIIVKEGESTSIHGKKNEKHKK